MDFRWIVFLTLWTVFSGPVLARPGFLSRTETVKAKPEMVKLSHSVR